LGVVLNNVDLKHDQNYYYYTNYYGYYESRERKPEPRERKPGRPATIVSKISADGGNNNHSDTDEY
jgi:hypothetical protein